MRSFNTLMNVELVTAKIQIFQMLRYDDIHYAAIAPEVAQKNSQ